ncbi:MAG: hypothetical protein ABSB10_02205 [Candidatus Bathyarchaeia archaeon]|jgi:hypothetical protein
MWTYTAYILGKYCEKYDKSPQKCDNLSFKEFSSFVFDVLWRKEQLIFHDGAEDLFNDFKYMQKLGIVELAGGETDFEKTTLKIKDKKQLSELGKIVENSASLTGVKLFDEYTRRINLALEEAPCVVSSK